MFACMFVCVHALIHTSVCVCVCLCACLQTAAFVQAESPVRLWGKEGTTNDDKMLRTICFLFIFSA